ncbi:MAG: hypothetical protein CSA23_02415 [Deltaproteobacteria bacterium]|nr:MAG: hypothetical protein CSA23_02415 [Deltaproteobacteria bacterium]
MYLARISDKNRGLRYIIRQSYGDGRCFRSRDLFDLGDNPAQYIVYPGGNGFYIHSDVEDAIAKLGISASQDELEPLFLPFVEPHIRRVIEGFDRRDRFGRPTDRCPPASAVHHFDRCRRQFLKLGQVGHRGTGCIPDRFYSGLTGKSRDEIEYDFIAAERILKAHERVRYTYEIFDLQRHFSEQFSRSHPEGLDQKKMDRVFIDALCRLNRDDSFWQGCGKAESLRPHLIRYVIMFFDYRFPEQDPFQDILRNFMNRHRIHRPPERVRVNLAKYAQLFGVSVETLKKMGGRELTGRYRKLAKQHHPDKGGDQETFVRLSDAYDRLMKRKSRD